MVGCIKCVHLILVVLLNHLILRLTSSVEESLKMINFLGVYIVTPLIICK